MGQITLDFDLWDKTKDTLLQRPGNYLGYTAILVGLDVGDMPTVRARERDVLIRECEEGALQLVAGGLEWLRSRGYSAQDIQSKIKSYKNNNKHVHTFGDDEVLRDKQVLKAINLISDPNVLGLEETVVIG